ncbi:hypothetical protein ABEB36_015225 [Hypothenemus hampei]|uniref:Uncharacterized protein n=1 Tax=Hypothenemus hampei TaxID=57062 RepID=A0ABD1E0R1_HYPHA
MDSFENPSFNSDIADEPLDLSLNSPANSTHTALTTPRGDGTSKNIQLSKERSSDQVQPHTNLNSKHSELNPPTTCYVDMTENRVYVPSPLGVVGAVWVLLAGEFKLKSRGSSAISGLKENKGQTEVCRRGHNSSSTKEGSCLQFILVPIVLWIQRGPQVGFFGKKKNATSTADTELDNVYNLKRDAR